MNFNNDQIYLFNASGCWVNFENQIENLYSNPLLDGIITKTCSLYQKQANPEPNFFKKEDNSIIFNNMGLPNNGYDYYKTLYSYYKKKYLFYPFQLKIFMN